MSNKHKISIEKKYHNLMYGLICLIDYNMERNFIPNLIDKIAAMKNGSETPEMIAPPKEPAAWALYQILVVMFGNYGTSPRAGWIEKPDEAIEFLQELMGE